MRAARLSRCFAALRAYTPPLRLLFRYTLLSLILIFRRLFTPCCRDAIATDAATLPMIFSPIRCRHDADYYTPLRYHAPLPAIFITLPMSIAYCLALHAGFFDIIAIDACFYADAMPMLITD